MIGNDIVDLKQARIDSNWKRKGFLEKIFTQNEQVLIFSSANQHQTVWLLWSMKEAAYKIYMRQFGNRFFNPTRLECNIETKTKGHVVIGDNTFDTISQIDKNYIHTIASKRREKGVKSSCFKIENTSIKLQSELSKKRVLETYSKIRNIPKNSVAIQKDAIGIPYFFQNNKKQKESLSIAHHGHYCAYVIL
ncbi:MAG: 4-phosphopantetheinyl transferase family protein [Flavobacteriaceae bacterium]|nr:4-phosphopantetheinyl transferase family protein [Flavobacteriaceae bacterium]